MTRQIPEPTIVELCTVPTFRSAARSRPQKPIPATAAETPSPLTRLTPRDFRILRLLADHGSAWAAATEIFSHGGYQSEKTVLNLVRQAASRAQLPLDGHPVYEIKINAAKILAEVAAK